MGFNHRSNERVAVSFVIFMSFLMNSFVMPILLQANFSADYSHSFWDLTFSDGGRNSDFGPTWYTDIGTQLTINLVLLSLLPLLIVLTEHVTLKLNRYMNINFWYKDHDNNNIDNIKFLELNAGPEHKFHIKTASLNCILFMTIVLGTTFPVFYLIALFAIILQYVVERYTLAVFYRLPPKFSLSMTEQNNALMIFSPLFSFAICFWLFGNAQMLNQEAVSTVDSINSIQPSHHTVGDQIKKALTFDLPQS